MMIEKLNCRPGGLAVIVRSSMGNDGKIVRCVRLASEFEKAHSGFLLFDVVWLLESPLPTLWGRAMPFAYDCLLRPIRDQPGYDETLAWAGLPKYREDHPASLAAVRESLEDLA